MQAGSGTPYYCSCIHRATNGQDSRSPTHFRADKRFGQERAGRERNGSGTRKRKVSRDLRPAIMVGLVSGTICWAMNEFLDSASDSEEELW